MLKNRLVLAAVSGAVVSVASAQSITTLFAQNNFSSAGGMVYFDVTAGPAPLIITGLDVNTLAAAGTVFGCQVYTHAGTFSGTELNAAAWTLRATGTGTAAGVNLASPVTLGSTFTLPAGATTAFAISLGTQGAGVAAQHGYTNGTGTNQSYSNPQVSLSLGSASNAPFTATVFTPRVWNGTIRYSVVQGACCLGDGSCTILPAATCTDQNGLYRGDGVTCANAECVCNSLSNGGFESGTFSGWTQFGNTGFTSVASVAHSGLRGGAFGPIGSTGGISRVVAAAAGTPLVIDFWFHSIGIGTESFSVDLGSVNLVNIVDDATHTTWTEFSIPVVAPTNNPVLRFTFRNDPGSDFLDDVRVCVGSPGCYANCDFSTTPPVLNVQDFACFLNKYAAGCT